MDFIIFSSDYTIAGNILRGLFIAGVITIFWLAHACKHAKVIKDERMELGMLAILPASGTVVILIILIGLFSWPKLKEHFRTGKMIDRY